MRDNSTTKSTTKLYPLATLNGKAAKLVQLISVKLIETVENQSQKLLNTRAKVSALLEDNVIVSLPFLRAVTRSFLLGGTRQYWGGTLKFLQIVKYIL